MTVSLEGYGVGVCLTAMALWLYLKWRGQEPSRTVWGLYILGVLAWPLLSIWLILDLIELRFWDRAEAPREEPSPEQQKKLDRLRSARGKDRY
jgi:hypothetical protein